MRGGAPAGSWPSAGVRAARSPAAWTLRARSAQKRIARPARTRAFSSSTIPEPFPAHCGQPRHSAKGASRVQKRTRAAETGLGSPLCPGHPLDWLGRPRLRGGTVTQGRWGLSAPSSPPPFGLGCQVAPLHTPGPQARAAGTPAGPSPAFTCGNLHAPRRLGAGRCAGAGPGGGGARGDWARARCCEPESGCRAVLVSLRSAPPLGQSLVGAPPSNTVVVAAATGSLTHPAGPAPFLRLTPLRTACIVPIPSPQPRRLSLDPPPPNV